MLGIRVGSTPMISPPGRSLSIEAELQSNEHATWVGSPSLQGMLVQQSPVMLLSLAFSVVPVLNFLKWDSEGNPENLKDPSMAAVCFVGIFVLVGIAAFGGALWRVCATGRTIYAVTNKRILIVTDLIRREVVSIYPDAINALECSRIGENHGSITFRREVVDTGEGNQIRKMKFVGIRNVKEAMNQIEKLIDYRKF